VAAETIDQSIIVSNVPARLDRLPWSRWHWLVVIALGITWVLDGLEVTLAGAVGAVLKRPDTLALSDAQIGASATFYLIGAVTGALFFGYLTDRLGRKRLFTITLLLYLSATALTASPGTLLRTRFFVRLPAQASAVNIPPSTPPLMS
jgi:MFS family permease